VEVKLDKETIRILLLGREVCDAAREQRGKGGILVDIVANEIEALQKLGFETFAEFMRFNDAMCIEALKQYRTATVNCDLCRDYKGTPPCTEEYNDSSCAVQKKIVHEDFLYQDLLRMYQHAAATGFAITSTSDQVINLPVGDKIRAAHIKDKKLTRCPAGQCSYKCEVPDSEMPFAIGWE